jgi:hypothetical protein
MNQSLWNSTCKRWHLSLSQQHTSWIPSFNLCLYVYAPIVARQRLGENVTAATNTHVTLEEFLDSSFSMCSESYQGR